MRKIPIYQLEFEDDFIDLFKAGCEQILTSDALAEGEYVRNFERKYAGLVDAKHAIAVSSGTDAIEVALRAIGVRNKKVIIPTNTFIATAIAAQNAGAQIELVDIEDDTFTLSPELLRNSISETTGAVIIVHIGGMISKYLDEIITICREYRVPLIEDAAHAHGSTRGSLRAGTIGAIGCFSFFPTKVMTTAEGGMITTNDDQLAELMRSIKNFGRDLSEPLLCINEGYNCKMTEFQGLLGCLELDRVEKRILKRTELADRYYERLNESVYDVIHYPDGINSYYKQIVKISISQNALRDFCKSNGVSMTGEVYRYPIHQQPIYRDMFNKQSFPVADYFAKHHVCPPLYPELSTEDIDYVCEVMHKAVKDQAGD